MDIPPTVNNDGIETNIQSIAEHLCKMPPGAENSVQLIMDHECDEDVIFDMVCDFSLSCLKILFGPNKTPHDLTPENFNLLNQYVRSIGYNMTYRVNEHEQEYEYVIKFERLKQSKNNPYEHLKKYM